jgi:hypothetical protein
LRLILAALCIAACTSTASAQTQSEVKQPGDSQPTGRTVLLMTIKGNFGHRAGPARSQPAAAARRRQGALKGSLRPACRLRPRVHQRASLIRSKATQSLKPAGVNRSGCISLAETPVSEGSLRNDREYPFVSLINVHRWFCIAGAPQDPAAERPSLKRNGPSAGCG